MFGLDDTIAGLSGGAPFLVVILVAVLLGLRHATDPDHIAAVSALVLQGGDRSARAAARLGAWWGLGHAVTLVLFGVPVLLAQRALPERAQQGAESAIAILIVFLAVRLLVRWRHDRLAAGMHGHAHAGAHRHPVRTSTGALGIGLVHGMGGSAGVGVLLLAAIPSETVAVAALVVLAVFTAVSMTVLTTGLGALVTHRSIERAFAASVPVVGTVSLGFGLWYAAAAWQLAPYPL